MSGLRAFSPPPGVLRVLLIEGCAELRIPIAPVPNIPVVWFDELDAYLQEEGYLQAGGTMTVTSALDIAYRDGLLVDWHCPAGVAGDMLWVQEMYVPDAEGWRYAATDDALEGHAWLPAHVMPIEASRMKMRVVDVGIGGGQGSALEWLAFIERVWADEA